MHGLGNDFMVIDAINQDVDLSAKQISTLARRDTGVGFDQCLLVEASQDAQSDFFYRVFNADGTEVGQCGNGARCLARFVYHYGLTTKKTISIATHTTKMQLQLYDDGTVTVDMGKPKLAPADVPLQVADQSSFYRLTLNDGSVHKVHAINVGNPHAVTVVQDLANIAIDNLGKQISEHPLFPEQCNAGFMQLIDENHIHLRVYERGCGETKACGSGAAAAAAAGRLYHRLAKQIYVHLIGGELVVNWPDINGSLYLTGPATFVYEGALMTCGSLY